MSNAVTEEMIETGARAVWDRLGCDITFDEAKSKGHAQYEWVAADVAAALSAALSVHAEPDTKMRDYPAEFEAWWETYRHKNRDLADYSIKKQIAFDAFYFAARTIAVPPVQVPVVKALRVIEITARQTAQEFAQWLHAGNSTGSLSRHAIDGLADSIAHVLSALPASPEQGETE